MFFAKTLAFFVAATAPLALGIPAEENTQADYWAQFCDDTACSQGCGESVSVSDPGCLNESGRKSILFHGTADNDYALVVSPSGNCPCQNTCSSVPSGSTCWDISGYSADQSFRFISGSCGSNNC
ncbi:hypothetical protein F4781DRAFT_214817 [Annulohypoxylon bovei var. microspora]|nr:hypothetical protein F4781DRAFT_214817 [Annulohypoxylon bovei var. microspora]